MLAKNTLLNQPGSPARPGAAAHSSLWSRAASWLLAWLLLAGAAHAQSLPWQQAQALGGSGGAFAVAHDDLGDEYVAGNFSGTLVIGGTTLVPQGSGQIFIAKRSAAGVWLWARRAGTTVSNGNDIGYRLAVVGSGASAQVFLSGRYMTTTNSTADFGPFTLSGYASGIATADIFVAALDGNGTWLWARRAGSAGGHDFAPGLAVAGSGASAQVFITGYCSTSTTVPMQFGTISLPGYSTSIGNDLFVASLDAGGNWLWARRAGSPLGTAGTADEMADNLVVTGSGASARVFMFGTYYASNATSAEFGPFLLGGIGTSASPDIFVAALDASGTWLWARRAGSAGYDFCYGACGTGSGASTRLYLTGSYSGSTSALAVFGTTTLAGYSPGGGIDGFVSALDGNGNWLWAKRMGGSTGEDAGWGIDVAGRGPTARLYVGGWYVANLGTTIDVGGQNLGGFGSTDGTDVFVAALDTAGNWKAAQRGGGPNGDHIFALSVVEQACNDRVTVVGDFTNSLALGGISLTRAGGTPWVGTLLAPNPGPTVSAIAGPAVVCDFSQPVQYSVPGAAGVGYQWVITGGTVAAGQGTSQVTVQFSAGATSYVVQVTPTAGTCTGAPVRRTISLDAPTASLTVASVEETDNSRVTLNPLATSSSATGTVQIWRRAAGVGSFAQVGTVPATATTFTDTGLNTAGTSYEYRLETPTACGTTVRSATVQTIRLEASNAGTTGTGGPNQGSTQLRWNAYVGFGVQSYLIYRRLDSGTWQLLSTVASTTLAATVPNLAASTPATGAGFGQEFRVVAVGAGALRANSNSVRVEFENPVRAYNIITPNGDNLNDVFVVDNITLYPGNDLRIFNRWGREVFAATNYQNNWGSAADVQAGTYYYLLTVPARGTVKGWVDVVK